MNANLEEKLAHLPAKPGAYMMKDARGAVIYVGKAASLRSRVRSYFQKGHAIGAKVQTLVNKVRDIEWIVTDTEIEALMLECNLIKEHRPKYNVRLRDDKHYPYLCITTSEPFPRAIIARRSKQDGNKYFGPYTDSGALRDCLRLIRRVFKIRGCNKRLGFVESSADGQNGHAERRDRPCLNYHLNQCLSPCSGKIDASAYADLVRDTCMFLEGRHDFIIERMRNEMKSAAERLDFERAARLRDQIEAVQKLAERQSIIDTEHADRDVISIVYQGLIGCVQLLLIRRGRLVGQETFFLEGASEESPEQALQEFVKQYYSRATYIPKEILVSEELPENDILKEWLRMRRGGAISIIHPKRGEKRRLIELATKNAELAVQREIGVAEADETQRQEMLRSLAEVLSLTSVPHRIEAYDIANIQGQDAVGSMVVFEDGAPAKSEYRRFKIRSLSTPDDYGMMREVLRRRFARRTQSDEKFAKLPDLLLVDGGKGQLNVALEVIAESGLNIPAVGLAKQFEEIYTPRTEFPIVLARNSPALQMLQRIRNEAHRFAQAYHHKLTQKKVRESVLDEIPGVGPRRRKALVRHFGSVARVRQASLEQLMQVPGITEPVARAIYDWSRSA